MLFIIALYVLMFSCFIFLIASATCSAISFDNDIGSIMIGVSVELISLGVVGVSSSWCFEDEDAFCGLAGRKRLCDIMFFLSISARKSSGIDDMVMKFLEER